jgi:Hemerythrin HHE cation binding domain
MAQRLGNQMIDVHIGLRELLQRIRGELDAAGPPSHAYGDLTVHCATFCSAVRRHHTAEDGRAFPVLAAEHPQLRPVLDELAHDHHVVAGLLARVDELVAAAAAERDDAERDDVERDDAALDRVRTEIDSLAAVLESHFTYEERKLVAALNRLRGEADADDFLGVALDR